MSLVVHIDCQKFADLSVIVLRRVKARGSRVDPATKEKRVIEGSNLVGE